jgi:hypothetical protein
MSFIPFEYKIHLYFELIDDYINFIMRNIIVCAVKFYQYIDHLNTPYSYQSGAICYFYIYIQYIFFAHLNFSISNRYALLCRLQMTVFILHVQHVDKSDSVSAIFPIYFI